MADTSLPPWMQTLGDTTGLPGLIASGYTGYKALKGAARYGMRAGAGIMGAPAAAAAGFATGITPMEWSGRDGSFGAGQGEKDLYVRDPDTGQFVPNPKNQQISMAPGASMNPMPASNPFPTIPNGMNPANPSVLSAPGTAAAGAFPPAAGGPSPPPMTAPVSPPGLLATPTGVTGSPGAAQLPPNAMPTGPASPGAGAPLSLAPPSPGPTQPPAGLYNGPGSANFGAGDQSPGMGTGGASSGFDLSKFLGGASTPDGQNGTDLSKFIQNNRGVIPGMLRAFTNNGQSIAPDWTSSNAWYNN